MNSYPDKLSAPEKTFSEWYYHLPVLEVKNTRNRIIDACGLKRDDKGFCPVFYHWLKGITPVPFLAQKEIDRIAGFKLKYTDHE